MHVWARRGDLKPWKWAENIAAITKVESLYWISLSMYSTGDQNLSRSEYGRIQSTDVLKHEHATRQSCKKKLIWAQSAAFPQTGQFRTGWTSAASLQAWGWAQIGSHAALKPPRAPCLQSFCIHVELTGSPSTGAGPRSRIHEDPEPSTIDVPQRQPSLRGSYTSNSAANLQQWTSGTLENETHVHFLQSVFSPQDAAKSYTLKL